MARRVATKPLRELHDAAREVLTEMAIWQSHVTLSTLSQTGTKEELRARSENFATREAPKLAGLLRNFRRLLVHPDVRKLRALHGLQGVEMAGHSAGCWAGLVGEIARAYCAHLAIHSVSRPLDEDPPPDDIGTITNAVLVACEFGTMKKLFEGVNVGKLQTGLMLEYEAACCQKKAKRTADSKTDNKNKSSALVPENFDVAKLAKKIKRDLPTGAKKTDIAREFTGNDEKKAQTLLRQLRRFPQLLGPVE